MKVTLTPGIESISGRQGNIIYKTYRRPGQKPETRAYLVPRTANRRKTPPTEGEINARLRFTQAADYWKKLSDNQKQCYREEWAKNKFSFRGKRYATLRGYVIARFYADSTVTLS